MEITTNLQNNIELSDKVIEFEKDLINLMIESHSDSINRIHCFLLNNEFTSDEIVYLAKILDRNVCILKQFEDYFKNLTTTVKSEVCE